MVEARAVARGEVGYPARLADLRHPPRRVFLRGAWKHEGRMVAIVGSRDADGDGMEVAYDIAVDLARAGVAVLSGLARGIDAAAHRGALTAGGSSGAVLGTPLDRVYPPEHRALQERLASSLGLITQCPSRGFATRGTFASRNRLLAALSDAVIVVQGRRESGALLTVDAARSIGRPVGAVPWSPRDPRGEAPLALLRQGAALIRNAGDALELIGMPRRDAEGAHQVVLSFDPAPGALDPPAAPDEPPSGESERRLLAALRRRPEPLEISASRAGLTIDEAAAALVSLELLGHAERAPGGAARRIGRG